MGIIQKNLYLPGQDLTNLAQNVDYNRYQDFKGNITVNFGTVPATVTVKVGTILEVNENLYAIETADYVFQMDNATHNYLTFTDNPAVDFGSAAAIGTYTAAKQGYYQAGNIIRTLPFYIDQTNKEVSRLMDEPLNNIRPLMKLWDRICVKLTGNQAIVAGQNILQLNSEIYDNIGNWNIATYEFTAIESGWYLINLQLSVELTQTQSMLTQYYTGSISHNGTRIVGGYAHHNVAGVSPYTTGQIGSCCVSVIRYITVGDIIKFYANGSAGASNANALVGENANNGWQTIACIERIL